MSKGSVTKVRKPFSSALGRIGRSNQWCSRKIAKVFLRNSCSVLLCLRKSIQVVMWWTDEAGFPAPSEADYTVCSIPSMNHHPRSCPGGSWQNFSWRISILQEQHLWLRLGVAGCVLIEVPTHNTLQWTQRELPQVPVVEEHSTFFNTTEYKALFSLSCRISREHDESFSTAYLSIYTHLYRHRGYNYTINPGAECLWRSHESITPLPLRQEISGIWEEGNITWLRCSKKAMRATILLPWKVMILWDASLCPPCRLSR